MKRVSREEVPELVDAELRRAVSPTSRVERKGPTRWEVISEAELGDARWGSLRSYEVYAHGHDVVITHSNTDAGALTVARLTRTATIIRVEVHPIFSITLAECFRHVFECNEPNFYGLT